MSYFFIELIEVVKVRHKQLCPSTPIILQKLPLWLVVAVESLENPEK